MRQQDMEEIVYWAAAFVAVISVVGFVVVVSI